jgi:hypothetical protein
MVTTYEHTAVTNAIARALMELLATLENTRVIPKGEAVAILMRSAASLRRSEDPGDSVGADYLEQVLAPAVRHT